MKPDEIIGKRVLLSALNWGYGHVSRSIGILYQLQKQGNELVIAGDPEQLEIFKSYFPNAELVELRGYPFEFKGCGNFGYDLFKARRNLIKRLHEELNDSDRIVNERQIDVIVSDHRYGFRSSMVKSIFVTHQLSLPIRWYQKPIQFWQDRLIEKFDHIWVLDEKDNRFAGKLSKSRKGQTPYYIGPYSRFMRYEENRESKQKNTLILSGPRIYAEQLLQQFGDNDFDSIISGFEIDRDNVIKGNWLEQDAAILNSRAITSRSGYSTIMDGHYLGVELNLIPTPGQEEQLYLAKLHARS